MRGRLFWKIFTAFFLTFIAQVVGTWAMFTLFLPNGPTRELILRNTVQADTLDLAADLVRSGGVDGLSRRISERGISTLRVRPSTERAPPGTLPSSARLVTAPGGVRYLIEYRDPKLAQTEASRATAPFYINVVGIVSGLLFSTFLALYLSRPIRSLRTGLEAFAAGDLGVRLGASIGRRRDEIADLARDFDGMADRVEQLVRAREQLIDDVSHELRSPITRLQLAIALARQRPERTAGALDRIEREALRLDSLVGELLTLSRLESGASDQGYFDLRDLLRDVIGDASFESGSTRFTFEIESGDEMPASSVRGDAELLRRAIENILRNATRHCPAGGTIAVRLGERDGEARIHIEDEGPGVAPDELQHIFEPFVRGQDGGFGLGLAIARRAVLAHGGSIAGENRDPSGLRVTIGLPTVTRPIEDEL